MTNNPPIIADVFHRAGLIEKWGRGTNRVIEMCKKHGVPPPLFEERQGFLIVTFRAQLVAEGAAGTSGARSGDQVRTKSGPSRDQVGTKSGPSGSPAALPSRTILGCDDECRWAAKPHQVPRRPRKAADRSGIAGIDHPRQAAKPLAKIPIDREGPPSPSEARGRQEMSDQQSAISNQRSVKRRWRSTGYISAAKEVFRWC